MRAMTDGLPELFLARLREIIPAAGYEDCVARFSQAPCLSVRVNTLKAAREDVLARLRNFPVTIREFPWSPEALVIEGTSAEAFGENELLNSGWLYRQQLASMLPAVVLDPRPGERVLDMCAAPGSKTTQIAALMRNEGEIVALEAVRSRYYRLRSVVEILGAARVTCRMMDARRFQDSELFDKVLVDAPCSSEGRFRCGEPKSWGYWSPRKIKEMAHKQRGLLLAASRLVRPGGTLVYSTCTFAPEENESAVDWLLRKTKGELGVAPIVLEGVECYPSLPQWQGREFDPQVQKTFRVRPGTFMEGFFIARFIKSG